MGEVQGVDRKQLAKTDEKMFLLPFSDPHNHTQKGILPGWVN